MFVDDERAERLQPVYESELLPAGLERLFVMRAKTAPIPSMGTLAALLEGVAPTDIIPDMPEICPESDATIFFTSGTTGKPKGRLLVNVEADKIVPCQL